TTATVNVPVIGDTKVEASETFSLVVTPSPEIANGTAASTGQALIVDDDSGGSLPTVSVRGAEISEGNANTSPLRFVVSLSKPSATAVAVDFQTVSGTALENVDFERIGQGGVGTIIFQPGETSKILGTGVVGDRLVESDENLTLELFNPKGAALADNAPALRAQGVILDDDGTGSKLALFVSNPILLEGDSGTKLAQFTVSLSRPLDTTITLPYRTVDGTATAGQDYTAKSGTLTFAPGQTTAAVNVPVSGDTTVEPSETFSLVVTPSAAITNGAAGATGQALILDDDAGGGTQPTMSVRGGEIVEGAPLRFVVSLSRPASAAVSVSYRAVSGTALENVDFARVGQAGYGTLLFAPGQTSRVVGIGTVADRIAEPTENFSLQLFNPHGVALAGGGLTVSAEGFILDNSPPCFAAGTRILTDRGEVPVEQLREGDRVITVNVPGPRRALPVEWIGHRRVDCSRHPEPRKVYPVRVRKDAFAPGMPSRDVWLSPDHAVYADDVLIPIKHLVNGRTITREQRPEITYYHVELAEHAVLLAEGLPAESLVPGSDRSRFANGGGRLRLHPDFDALAWEADGCAPLVVTGPTLEAVRRRLDQQAENLCSPAPQFASG
ncbi:MAG: Hint domain-containing protein, partial [Rhodospirillales bacterium]|nr:Hint domain-containing protein [Rhodospirillales bacterium]